MLVEVVDVLVLVLVLVLVEVVEVDVDVEVDVEVDVVVAAADGWKNAILTPHSPEVCVHVILCEPVPIVSSREVRP